VVDEERRRPVGDFSLVEVSALSFLQFFDAGGWVTGRHSLHKNLCHL